MLRTRSCVSDGRRPTLATTSAILAVSLMARIWMLPRDVSSMASEPHSLAARANASSCAGVIMPPGRRTRASAPSAAWCT